MTTRRRRTPRGALDSTLWQVCAKILKAGRGSWAVTKGLEIRGGGCYYCLHNQNVRVQPWLYHVELCDLGKVTPPLCVSVSTSGRGAGGNRECEGWEALKPSPRTPGSPLSRAHGASGARHPHSLNPLSAAWVSLTFSLWDPSHADCPDGTDVSKPPGCWESFP